MDSYIQILCRFQKCIKLVNIYGIARIFQNYYWGGTVEEVFAYIFGIYKKFGGDNPSIWTPLDSVNIAT